MNSKSPILLLAALCATANAIAPVKIPHPVGTIMPAPVYEHIGCGETWLSNYTFINSDLSTYFAVVDAAEFTVVATVWESEASTPACENGAYVEFAPNTGSKDDDFSYGPQQHYFKSGESFEFKVNNVNNTKVQSFDWIFWNPGNSFPCNYDIKLKQVDIVC